MEEKFQAAVEAGDLPGAVLLVSDRTGIMQNPINPFH
jgi:hypothetical protein